MTLKKVQTGSSFPFLLPQEASFCKTATVYLAPREMEVKDYNSEDKIKKTVVDIEMSKLPDREFYEKLELDEEMIQRRLESKIRTWSMNGRSLNFLIDKLGDQEDKWPAQKLELEVEKVMISGKKKNVIYPKGAVEE